MNCVGGYEKAMNVFLNDEPMFEGYNSFIEYWKKNKQI